MSASKVTSADWAAEVLESDRPVLVDFWAEWCGPCKAVGPIVDEIADEQAARLKVVKLNIDENPDVARTYGITSIPTMLVFSSGEPATRIVGAKPKKKLLKELDAFVG